MRILLVTSSLVIWSVLCFGQTGKLIVKVFPLTSVITMDGDTIDNQVVVTTDPGTYVLTATAVNRAPLTDTVVVLADSTVKWDKTLQVSAAFKAYSKDFDAWRKTKFNNAILKTSMLTMNVGLTALVAGYLPIMANNKVKAANDALAAYTYQFDPTLKEESYKNYIEKKEAADKMIKTRNILLGVSIPVVLASYGLTVLAWKKADNPGPKPQKKDYGIVTNIRISVFPDAINPEHTRAGLSFNF